MIKNESNSMHVTQSFSEDELISKCKSGELKFQEKLYKHFYGYAMGVGMRYLKNRDDVLEVVNDSFIKVFKSIQSYNEHQPFKAWLRRIIVNTSIDHRRRNLKHMNQADIDEAIYIGKAPDIIENINAKDILKLLDILPETQKLVFNLYEIDGYSHDEIGEMLSIPVSSSRVYLSRAKEKLRKHWIQQEGSYAG
ncbi:RNA polymerase ECF-type sigma factor [Arcticibacter svalbardensis MN12-7]|uniref:RNA polymerase ECF-type sigma factor n=1 Tax=Arcticibacter svalbardensis MN12-7 TaxID=1150600 RepID=R9GTD3_9SPHI|nr:RNA polymerase sigma factor [Arcticibacter svalbardensis]EOR94805.1 RNA polymerase ECF-type sigma factor [Arcticibacter svalbardensis MN12-7]